MPVMDQMGFAHYDMTPEQFAAAMKKLIEASSGVVGGCWAQHRNISGRLQK